MRQQTRVVTRLRHLLRFLTKEERRGFAQQEQGETFTLSPEERTWMTKEEERRGLAQQEAGEKKGTRWKTSLSLSRNAGQQTLAEEVEGKEDETSLFVNL